VAKPRQNAIDRFKDDLIALIISFEKKRVEFFERKTMGDFPTVIW